MQVMVVNREEERGLGRKYKYASVDQQNEPEMRTFGKPMLDRGAF